MKMNLNGFQRLIMRINGNWVNIHKYAQILSAKCMYQREWSLMEGNRSCSSWAIWTLSSYLHKPQRGGLDKFTQNSVVSSHLSSLIDLMPSTTWQLLRALLKYSMIYNYLKCSFYYLFNIKQILIAMKIFMLTNDIASNIWWVKQS